MRPKIQKNTGSPKLTRSAKPNASTEQAAALVDISQEALDLALEDATLHRFMDLNTQVRELTKELDALKESIKARGSYATAHYVASVEVQSVMYPPSLADLIKAFGESVRGLCKEGTRTIVRVTEKKGGN